MSFGLKIVKGMKDTLPEEMGSWYYVENHFKSLLMAYGYQEIRMPLLEQTALFKRAIGEVTDIVEKEMYTFLDKGGEMLTLRPEGTAQCVRAILENSLTRNQSQRLWYQGAMFRRENPQKGRYRQFTQLGVEAYGLEGPDVDVEQLLMMSRLWHKLGINDKIALQLNSLGTAQERLKYRETLVKYFKAHSLDPESQKRLENNPLRILDSKNSQMQAINKNAPSLLEFLGKDSLQHFETLQKWLKDAGVIFEINPRLVRGLDYYTHTVYEWVTTALGSQGTVCAGGRYNDLVEQMGGQPTPAVGFALGIERLVMLLNENQLIPSSPIVDVYCVVDKELQNEGLLLAEKLRTALPTLRILMHCGEGNFKSQFKKADKSGAQYALILGSQEMQDHKISIKSLRDNTIQQSFTSDELISFLKSMKMKSEPWNM